MAQQIAQYGQPLVGRDVMSNVVFQETSVPGRPSPRRRCVHVSHSCSTGLQHLLLASSIAHELAHNLLLKRRCCHFAQAIGVTSDPRITFPYLLKIRASTLGLRAVLAENGNAIAGLKAPSTWSLDAQSVLISIRPS